MEPTTINRNEIITLILADMRNRKLIMGLEALGLSTTDFNSNLAQLIFSKMEVSKQQEAQISTWYEDTVHCLLSIDLNKFKMHQLFFAIQLYDALLERKKMILEEPIVKQGGKKFPFLKWSWCKRN